MSFDKTLLKVAVRQRLRTECKFVRDTLENRTEEAVAILSTTAILGKIIQQLIHSVRH